MALRSLDLLRVEAQVRQDQVEIGEKSGQDVSITLSQGELASLIGATRETTSTTLNSLSRRGLIRLGRRQLILPSIDQVRTAAADRAAKAVAS